MQPVLFGVTGAQINISELEGSVVGIGVGILLFGIVMRILATVLVGIGSKLNLKEKLFVSLCWMSKATVQVCFFKKILKKKYFFCVFLIYLTI